MSGAAIVLQARMGSTRLPGKALAQVEGRSILVHCVERLRARSGLPVLLATTSNPQDDVLAEEASRLDVPIVRGAVDNVLARFVQAAAMFDLTEVIRATADNPAVDMDAPRRTLELLRRTGAGYVVEHGLPYGGAVEAVSVAALRYADVVATDPRDREHVTPLLRRDRRFRSIDALAPATVRRPELRLSVDTAEDLEWVRSVVREAAAGSTSPAPLADLIAAAERLVYGDQEASGVEVR